MIERDEWLKRCAARIMRNENISIELATQFADAMADDQEEINGSSGIAWELPENAADEAKSDDGAV